jgi:hypothetical protein
MPPIPGLEAAVSTAIGGQADGRAEGRLQGFHITVGYETAAVYLVTDRLFALFEANADGRSYTLTCPLARIRRVGRFEDANYTRLIVELDADRAVTRSVLREDGSSEGEVLPAGYELLESEATGRQSLAAFHAAIGRALAA